MPGEEVDRPALAVDGVSRLGYDIPPVGTQSCHHRRDDGRVTLVKQSVEEAPAPRHRDDQTSIDHGEHRANVVKTHPAQLATFEIRDVLLAHVGADCYVLLPQTEAQSQSPERATHPDGIHSRRW